MQTSCRTVLILAVLLAPLTAVHREARGVELTHVHGLAYSGDGKRLMVPSHHGRAK